MTTSRQTRSGRTYLEFGKDLEDARIIKIALTTPALEELLQDALAREPPLNDSLEGFGNAPPPPPEPRTADRIHEPSRPYTTASPSPTSITSIHSAGSLPSPSALPNPLTTPSLKRPAPPIDCEKGRNFHRHSKRQRTRDAKYKREGHLHGRNERSIVNGTVQATSQRVVDLPSATGGFIGRDLKCLEAVRSVEWYRSQPDWQYIHWDGSQALLLVDDCEHIFLAGLKKISDPTLDKEMSDVGLCLEDARTKKLVVKPGEDRHLRGEGFVAAATGWSMGQGQKRVTHTAGDHEAVLQDLIQKPCIKRLAAIQDAGFACWSFKNYAYYKDSMEQLRASIPGFKPNFERSNFACITFNFGPRVCTSCHTDAKNCPHSMCAVTAVGVFDPSKGGHLVLRDLKVILEFPPGCTILLPSAILRHENTPVQAHETRYSVTQYSAGGIFRFQEYGNRTEGQLRSQDKVLYERVMGQRCGRWANMVEMFVTLDEVRQFHGI